MSTQIREVGWRDVHNTDENCNPQLQKRLTEIRKVMENKKE